MIPIATTTLHFLSSTDPADGYEDAGSTWTDVAQVPAHLGFLSTQRSVGSGGVSFTSGAKFECDLPDVAIDLHMRVLDEATGKTFKLTQFGYSQPFDCLIGRVEVVEGQT